MLLFENAHAEHGIKNSAPPPHFNLSYSNTTVRS